MPPQRGGVGRYLEGLLGSLKGEVTIVSQLRDAERLHELAPGARVVSVSPRVSQVPVRLLWEQFALPRLARRLGVEVIFSPHYTLPLLSRRARVVTFHDATFFTDPGVHLRGKRIFFRVWSRISWRLAKVAIVPSHATESELTRVLGRRRGPVVVAHHGVDHATFRPPSASEVDAFASGAGLTTPWIAFLGTLEPRKNVGALVRVYRALAQERATIPALLLAGAHGWDDSLDGELARIEAPGVARRLGYLPQDSLRALLGGAALVVYPSLGEGFGLPVLEAMASGGAVLTTDRLALPEVGSDAVAYGGPDDESLGIALAALLDDDERRATLRSRAVARAGQFTWEAAARLHEDAFARAAG